MATLVQLKEGAAGIRLRIEQPQFRIGRAKNNDLSIDDELVSKLHSIIEMMENKERATFDYYIQDQQSTNGTYVNDKKIDLYKLSNGDVVRIGLSNFKFLDDTNDDPAETAQLHKTWIPGVFVTKPKKKKAKKKVKKKPGKASWTVNFYGRLFFGDIFHGVDIFLTEKNDLKDPPSCR